MNRFILAAMFLSASLLAACAAQAMSFPQFDHMAAQDRQDFLDSLPRDAEMVLNQEGRSADAAKVHQLFNNIISGDALPIGEAELEGNLANARVADAKRAIQDASLPRIQVEAALAVTLKKNGIELSPDFLKGFAQLAGTFQPKVPPQH